MLLADLRSLASASSYSRTASFRGPRGGLGAYPAAGPRPRGPSPARTVNAPSAQHLSSDGRNRARFACARRNTAAYGLPLENFTHTFRTVTRTSAPIFNSFSRI